MFFTQTDLRKIENYLRDRGIKDSQFKLKETLKEDDFLVVLQDGENVRIPVTKLIKEIGCTPISKAWLDSLFAGKVKIPTEEWSEVPEVIVTPVDGGDCCCEEATLAEVKEVMDSINAQVSTPTASSGRTIVTYRASDSPTFVDNAEWSSTPDTSKKYLWVKSVTIQADGDIDTSYSLTTNGASGANGANGNTPYIENGYWYINGVNTGFKAAGSSFNIAEDSDVRAVIK